VKISISDSRSPRFAHLVLSFGQAVEIAVLIIKCLITLEKINVRREEGAFTLKSSAWKTLKSLNPIISSAFSDYNFEKEIN
jgi:hypothetical protein